MPPPPPATAASLPAPTISNAVGRGCGATLRKTLGWFGPGYLVAVGYMDPGNWATDIAAGSAYGYELLFIVLLSSLMAMVLQTLAAKLGIATGLDLAEACRRRYSRPVVIGLWLLCEFAIIACDLAEVIGAAIALKLLFGLPLIGGILLTSIDVLLILALQKSGFRKIETFAITLVATVALCFAIELVFARPQFGAIVGGMVPHARLITDPGLLYLGIGIVGATVMPHNLYLHSSLVKSRAVNRSDGDKREALRFAIIDSNIALSLAFLVNAAILILAASSFHSHGHTDVASIEDAYCLLSPLLGTAAASTLFAIALLASGQNATMTGTMAGQIVLEGFTDLHMAPWVRRSVSRLLAVVPAIIVVACLGEGATTRLLIFSQVVLSLQLPFAVIPLLRMTGDPDTMGRFVNGKFVSIVTWGIAAVLVALDLKLLVGEYF
jgi:manganese transport protein